MGHTEVKFDLPMDSSSQYMFPDDGSSDMSASSKAKEKSGFIVEDKEFNSYYSDAKPLGIIKELSHEESMSPQKEKKKNKDKSQSGFNLSDFTSIKEDFSAHNSTLHKK